MKCPFSLRAFGGSWPLLILLACLPAAALALPANVRLVSSSGGSISFEVVVPAPRIVPGASGEVRVLLDGYGTFSPPGAVELPGRTFRVAIPPGGQARFSVSVIEEQSLGPLKLAHVAGERVVREENGIPVTEPYYPPDPWQEGYCPPLVSADAPCFMGRQRILPINVNPLQIDPNGARLARKLAITITFEQPAGVSGAGMAAAAPVSGAWQRLYDGLLVNPGSVAALRKPLAPAPAVGRLGEAVKRLKILVSETGLYALRADSLIAAGLSPGLSTGEIALRYYYYDETQPSLARAVEVPAFFIEGTSGAPGVFDGNDLLVFYALGIKDDPDALDLDARYTDDDVIWLEEQVAGSGMSSATLSLQIPGDPVPTFPAIVKSRKDTFFYKTSVAGTTDFYFSEGPQPMQTSLPFDLRSPASAGGYSITLRAQGNDKTGLTHTLVFSLKNSNGTFRLGNGLISAKEAKTFVLQDTTASRLVNGRNELVIACNSDYAYMVNDFTVDYPALFVAHGNMLDFTLPMGVDYKDPVITGFTVNHGYLIDVTNPRAPVYQELPSQYFTPDGSGYKLTLALDAAVDRHYIVLGSGAGTGIPVCDISVDTPSQLRGTAGSYNVMAIVHKDFMQRFAEYVDRRRSQGYRIVTADIEDVYDEFNGGRHSPYAVKRFIKYGFDHWGVEFVILVGDGQMDCKQVMKGNPPAQRGSPPDYVPTYTYSVNVSGLYDDEVTVSDKWYAFLDETLPVDAAAQAAPAGAGAGSVRAPLAHAYPDVFIGRLSVGRDVELRAVLNKTTRFETATSDDSWRRRVVLFADDAWSGRGTEDPYRAKSYEGQFEWSTDTCGAVIEQALPGGFDVRRCFMSHWTTGAHPNGDEQGPAVYERAVDTTRAYFTPYLLKELNQGCLFFMFQGHASRSVMTHEAALASFLQYNDIDSLKTFLPNVFIGVGCHISDFAPAEEYSLDNLDGPDGDCFSEQMLFKPGGGSAVTYASTGFEYLSQNSELVETVFRALFKNPPADSVEPTNQYTGAHWIFSEAVTEGEIEQIDQSTFGLEMALRYTILGDPLLRIDPGPPLMRLEADWGRGYRPLAPDSFRAQNGTNKVKLSLRVSDVVAVGKVALQVNGADWTDSLTVTPLVDAGKTYARSYRADLDYTINPKDELLVFRVSTPAGVEAGVVEIPIVTTIKCSVDGLELLPGVDSPPTGTFTVAVDFPSFLSQPPVLSIDGLTQEDVHFTVPNAQDSLHWQAVFGRTLPSGRRVFTVKAGDFSKDFTFNVTGSELAATAFTFPNPFRHNTNIVYTLNLPADAGRIEIYTVSGILIRKIEIPPSELGAASFISPHSIVWDGRDLAGDQVANGTYIYLIFLDKGRQSVEIKGKSVKLE